MVCQLHPGEGCFWLCSHPMCLMALCKRCQHTHPVLHECRGELARIYPLEKALEQAARSIDALEESCQSVLNSAGTLYNRKKKMQVQQFKALLLNKMERALDAAFAQAFANVEQHDISTRQRVFSIRKELADLR